MDKKKFEKCFLLCSGWNIFFFLTVTRDFEDLEILSKQLLNYPLDVTNTAGYLHYFSDK